MRKRIPYIETGTVKTKGIEVGTFVEKQMVWDLQKLMDEKGISNQDERDKMMMMWGPFFIPIVKSTNTKISSTHLQDIGN